jgi:HlyD family secretion protein
MSRRTTSLLVMAALALAALLAWWKWQAPSVPAMQVQQAPLLRTLLFSARVAATSRVELGSTVTGRVLQVLVLEGAPVRRGDALVRLESDELRAALSQARAGEQQAAARIAGLRSSGRRAVQASVAQADSVLIEARAELQRTRDLVARGFVSASRLDQAQRALAVAQAQQDSASAQRAANAEPGTEVAQAQAQLALAQAAVAAAQARLAQAVLTAPADGRVLRRAVEPGQIVQPGRALLTLALVGPTELVGQVDERFLEQLQAGQPATVVADAFPSQRFVATVRSIAPLVDAQRGAVEVKLALPPTAATAATAPTAVTAPTAPTPPAFLREDMTLSVEVETGRRERALVVPLAALVVNTSGAANGATRVRVVRDGRVEERTVRLGMRTLDAAEVLQGLVAGDVVLLGAAVKPGQRVQPDTSAAAALRATPRGGEDVGSAMSNAMGR